MEDEEKKSERNKMRLMIIFIAISTSLIGIGVFLGDPGILGNMIIIGLFISAVPYFFFKYSKYMFDGLISWARGKGCKRVACHTESDRVGKVLQRRYKCRRRGDEYVRAI